VDYPNLFAVLTTYIEGHGIAVREQAMDAEVPGEFDGLTITVNTVHPLDARCYYLAHSFGSIVAWSLDLEGAHAVFRELRGSKSTRISDPDRFERALKRFCDFEELASEYAVWVLAAIGHQNVVPPYTEFFRADAESMTMLHRDGTAPPWSEFFAAWKRRVASGEQRVAPYLPRPVPPFRPVRIEKQQVVQEVDGG
jgi:hypothetical protein